MWPTHIAHFYGAPVLSNIKMTLNFIRFLFQIANGNHHATNSSDLLQSGGSSLLGSSNYLHISSLSPTRLNLNNGFSSAMSTMYPSIHPSMQMGDSYRYYNYNQRFRYQRKSRILTFCFIRFVFVAHQFLQLQFDVSNVKLLASSPHSVIIDRPIIGFANTYSCQSWPTVSLPVSVWFNECFTLRCILFYHLIVVVVLFSIFFCWIAFANSFYFVALPILTIKDRPHRSNV